MAVGFRWLRAYGACVSESISQLPDGKKEFELRFENIQFEASEVVVYLHGVLL